MERPEVSVLSAVKHDCKILCANNTSQECEGAHLLITSCHNEILRTIFNMLAHQRSSLAYFVAVVTRYRVTSLMVNISSVEF